MKKLILCYLFNIATLSFADSHNQMIYQQPNTNKTYYGADGSYQGRSMDNGNSTYFYDNTGKVSGRSQQLGDTTYYYDANGKMSGFTN